MKNTFFTPGPTELYPEVGHYLQQAVKENVCSINHRSKEFIEIYKHTHHSLKKLLNIPDNYAIFFLNSATECMDRIIQNCVENTSFHFINGAFAERFCKTSAELHKKIEKIEVEYGKGFNFKEIIFFSYPELFCITQNETSTGVAIEPEEIYGLRKKFPEALIAVDIVTSAPYVNIDFDKIDCAFFSVQKGFGLPAGLGVLMVNFKCIEKAIYLKSKNVSIGSYHNFLSLYENAVKYQTTETPNVIGIYLLGKVCEDMLKRGIKNIRTETEEKSELLYDFFDNHKTLKPFVNNPADRSKTIINIVTGKEQAMIKKNLSDHGIIVGSGYGSLKESQIRIANFPMHKIEDVKKIIRVLSH
ncbi:MAG TPA: aminotransferase class V-fold PLP-dependent enzyme [Ignavibacteria bacterium]|nr:aminotransferase class V-fold PLP-dependent enzyme [Ignavibacteria bacterium]HMR40475.1 aminotransferase class V-fold PLP-dependent enzyme [Ignavibacteria bacterium]